MDALDGLGEDRPVRAGRGGGEPVLTSSYGRIARGLTVSAVIVEQVRVNRRDEREMIET